MNAWIHSDLLPELEVPLDERQNVDITSIASLFHLSVTSIYFQDVSTTETFFPETVTCVEEGVDILQCSLSSGGRYKVCGLSVVSEDTNLNSVLEAAPKQVDTASLLCGSLSVGRGGGVMSGASGVGGHSGVGNSGVVKCATVPGDPNGFLQFQVPKDKDTNQAVTSMATVTDCRPWATAKTTTQKGVMGTMRLSKCLGGAECRNTSCPFLKESGRRNTTSFKSLTFDKAVVDSCKYCQGLDVVRTPCQATKRVHWTPDSDVVNVTYTGNHSNACVSLKNHQRIEAANLHPAAVESYAKERSGLPPKASQARAAAALQTDYRSGKISGENFSKQLAALGNLAALEKSKEVKEAKVSRL
jgi:hypothetical protein